jgi:hypothetical protein
MPLLPFLQVRFAPGFAAKAGVEPFPKRRLAAAGVLRSTFLEPAVRDSDRKQNRLRIFVADRRPKPRRKRIGAIQ